MLLPSVGTPDHLNAAACVHHWALLLTASSRTESSDAGRIHHAARLLAAASFLTLPVLASRFGRVSGRHDRRFIYISRVYDEIQAQLYYTMPA